MKGEIIMTDEKSEPTPEVKITHIKEALDILGFEETMGFYVKPHKGTVKIVVDLTEDKKAVYFRDGQTKIVEDDEDGTLAKLGAVVIDAEQGIMPEQTEPKGEVEAPKQDEKKDRPVPSHKPKQEPSGPTQQGELPDQQEVEDHAPAAAEIVHNTAAPLATFQPTGMMMIMDIEPGLAEIGAIKIGGLGEERKSQRSGQPYRLPVKYDHFVILTKQKDDKGNYIVDPIMKKWGFSGTVDEGPVELEIYLLYNDPTANFLTSYRQYKGGKCLCSGNGIEALKADGTKIKCNPKSCPVFMSKQCKPNGILSVILKDSPTLGGVYKFRTTSYNSIRQILSSMFFMQSVTGGFLANIPLKMTLTPKTVNPIESPSAQTVYIVNLEFPGNAEELHKKTLELVRERASMKQEILTIEAQAKLAICAPESKEDIEDVEVEYYSENEQETST